MAFNYKLGTTIQDVLKNFGLSQDHRNKLENILLDMGYTNKGVAYIATKYEEKLMEFKNDPRFDNIFINYVVKYALLPGDPRWERREKKN